MDHELVGLRPVAGRLRPVAGGALALVAFVLALLPVRPTWLWMALIVAAVAVPWVLGAFIGPRPAPYWRLTEAGLERIERDGTVGARYDRTRIEELAVTTEDGVLTVFHKFGRTTVGELAEMGLEPLPLFIMARRFGIPIHMLDADISTFSDDDEPAPGRVSERRLLDLEAELLAAAHDPVHRVDDPSGSAGNDPTTRCEGRNPVRLESSATPARRRLAVVGVLTALLALIMIARVAVESTGGPLFSGRLAAGGWALLGAAALIVTRRRLVRTAPIRWEVTAEAIKVGRQTVPAADVAAIVVGPGLIVDEWTGEPRHTRLCGLVFGYQQDLLARLPADKLDPFQLAHALDEHGYRVVAPGPRALKPSEYGLDGLPEVFAQVPGGRLVVHENGLGWADAAGDVVLKMPADRIGGIELLTIGGHAWLRVYDAEGDEFFAAPLSVLRIARTELRDSARQAGLSVTDAEYEAYLNAAFHGTVSAFATATEPATEPDTVVLPPNEPGVVLDATWRSRVWTFAVTVTFCEIVAVLGAMWLGGDPGGIGAGFGATLAWAAPLGLVLGLGGAWLHDRNRAQLRISAAGIASITRRGRVEWTLDHETVGGVGVDDSEQGMPRLVVWSPAGRVMRRVSCPTDLKELRRACERYGLPWGPPATGLPKPPPPEL
jgi:hypothetical protein